MSAGKYVRSGIAGFEPYSPGLSIDEIREKYGLAEIIKLASNENPLGTSPVAQKVLTNKASYAFRYPQAGSPRLAKAIASYLGVAPENIVAGNGSDELIDLLVSVRPEPGRDNIVAFLPCFSMYKLQSRLRGVEFRQVRLNDDFSFPFDALKKRIDENTAIVFIASPDNPTGYTATADELESFARFLPENCLLVVDEAYIEFAEPMEKYSLLPRFSSFDNVVLLRTYSKIWGLAGLRLGYGIMPAPLADYLLRVKLPFSVNILAEEAGIAVLGDKAFITATRETVISGRDYLSRELKSLNFEVFPSMANFLMAKPPVPAGALFERLLEKGVIIRHLKGFDLPDYLRVSIGTMSENEAFIREVKTILN